MIPGAYIYEWQQSAPLQSNAQIEQDLFIERALIELFSTDMIRENLAFRGGTALHKIFLKSQVRYSEDIDLAQLKPGPVHQVIQEIKKALSFLVTKRSTKQNLRMNTIYERTLSKVEFLENLGKKIVDPEFPGDTTALLRPKITRDPATSNDLIKTKLIEKS